MNAAHIPDWQLLVSAADVYAPALIGVLVLINLVFLVLIILERKANRKFREQHLELLTGLHTENIEEFIIKYKNQVAEALTGLNRLENRTDALEQQLADAIQKVGMVRYNAFPGLGGEQSFSLALLDNKDNGVVVTSIYGREDSRFFAKSIVGGKSHCRLTDEEMLAIERARQ